ncbi:YnbE family lipoprotein [Sphingopyxis indica]|uniref:YnbE-like lipoprotein n=1 Tax=Sphingopyxis indica TaxID=436663 RepID=A0A239EC46_9SPHN|nr:YnbE family lipoprotein [Sphingopyxis indica]WOF41693.1 YnbE family lipoprotein [Sphingopyxis indica]SNS42079.1 YnbE-like lipoprotein [Sphingopyxis indica]
MTRTEIERRWTVGGRKLAILGAAASLAACVQVDTPDKPIEINLNINIKQEIVYKLDGDAKKLIEQNGDIF